MKTLPEHITKFRLGLYTSDYEQPISLMRVLGPFAAMAKEDRRLELVLPPTELVTRDGRIEMAKRLNWDWIVQCDAVFMLHPEHDVHVHSASLMWQMGIPLWAEFVDDIFAVEVDNPAFQLQMALKEKRENVTSICDWASVVTCVSEINRRAILDGLNTHLPLAGSVASPSAVAKAMADRGGFERKFLVLPEGAMWPRRDEPRQKVVSWRGLGSHSRDVREVLPHILEAAKAFPDWKWLLGGDPSILAGVSEALEGAMGTRGARPSESNVLCQPYWPTPFEAMQAWGGQCPFLHIVPLADTIFNRSKSHLAWLEASAVGAAVIVPDHLPEWQQPGTIPYRHSNLVLNGAAQQHRPTLTEVLKREMARFDGGGFHPNVAEAREAIWGEEPRTLWAMNQRRWAILRKLCQMSFVTDLRSAPDEEVGA